MHTKGNHWHVPSFRFCLCPLHLGLFPMVNRNVTNVEGAANEVQFLTAIMCHIFISNAIVNGQNPLLDSTRIVNISISSIQKLRLKLH